SVTVACQAGLDDERMAAGDAGWPREGHLRAGASAERDRLRVAEAAGAADRHRDRGRARPVVGNRRGDGHVSGVHLEAGWAGRHLGHGGVDGCWRWWRNAVSTDVDDARIAAVERRV